MEITPDQLVLFRWGFVQLNATIVYTWVVMLILVLAAWMATRKLTLDGPRSGWATALEAIVAGMRSQVREISGSAQGDACLPFIGTLFLFIAGFERAGRRSRLACSHRLPFHHRGPGNLCGGGSASVRHTQGRAQRIPAPLLEPDASSCCRSTS